MKNPLNNKSRGDYDPNSGMLRPDQYVPVQFYGQFGGEKGKKFMSKNLRELLATNSHLPMEEQKALLETTFKNWVGNLEQVDDVTLIGVRI